MKILIAADDLVSRRRLEGTLPRLVREVGQLERSLVRLRDETPT